MEFVVTLSRGGPWDWSLGLQDQDGFDEHSRYMDALVDEGFLLLGGPLASEREVILIMSAASEDQVRSLLAEDNWARDGRLTVKALERWTVLLDGLDLRARQGF